MEPWMVWLVYLSPGVPVAVWIAARPEKEAREACRNAGAPYSRSYVLAAATMAGVLWPITLLIDTLANRGGRSS